MEIVKKNTLFRRLMMLVAIVAIGVSMAACSDDDDEQQQAAAVDLTTGEWYADDDMVSYELVFDEDGFEMELYDEDQTVVFTGSYSLSGNNVSLKFKYCSIPDESLDGMVMTGVVENDRLVFSYGDESIVFYRESYDEDDDEDWDYDYDDK